MSSLLSCVAARRYRSTSSDPSMRLKTLRAKLLVPTLTLSVLVMVAAVAVGANMVVHQLNDDFVANADDTMDFVAKVSVPYVTNYDLTALGTFVKELSRDREVAYVEFFDSDNKSLTGDVAPAPANKAGLLLLEREMKDSSGKLVGRLKAGFRDVAVVKARNHVLTAIGGGMLAVLLVVVGALLWSARQVMKTIGAEPEEAVAFADGIASGDLTRNAKLSAMDSSSPMSALT